MITTLTARGATGRREGIALIAALVAALAAGGMAAAMMTLASSANRASQVRLGRATAKGLAEGALELVIVRIREELAESFQPSLAGTIQLGGRDVAYTVSVVNPVTMSMTNEGLNAFVATYRVETQVDAGARARANTIVQSEILPVFQFAIFYENDLQFNPAPPMTVTGPVHSNGDIYLYPNTSLTVDANYFRSAQSIYQYGKHQPDTIKPLAEVFIRKWVENPTDAGEPVEFAKLPTEQEFIDEGIASNSGMDSLFGGLDLDLDGYFDGAGEYLPFGLFVLEEFSEPDFYGGESGSTVLTAEHGVPNQSLPSQEQLMMFVDNDVGAGDHVWNAASGQFEQTLAGTGTHDKGKYHEDAGLSILALDGGGWIATDALGIDVTAALADAITESALYDRHQGGDIGLLIIDMEELAASGLMPANGLLYTSAYGAGEGTAAYGFQLTNGEELLAPMTVVSENQVFVHGDYNTVNKKPAAVMADRVNLLSNSWDGTKSVGDLPGASQTEYNFALLSGDNELVAPGLSLVGKWNGGVPNLPRFHENWLGVDVTLRGSMACLFRCQFATSYLKLGGDGFAPPNRNFLFDEDFQDINQLPPFTPSSVSVVPVVRW